MSELSDTVEYVALGLGSNLGDCHLNLRAAIEDLAPYLNIIQRSAVYETPPAYVTNQPTFLNAAILGTTKLSPLALLWSIKHLEGKLGRQPTFQYGPRLIDIDIVFFGNRVVKEPELILPHPRMAEREFVLRPLADIAPDWKHPVTNLSVTEMLNRLPEQTAVRTTYSLM